MVKKTKVVEEISDEEFDGAFQDDEEDAPETIIKSSAKEMMHKMPIK